MSMDAFLVWLAGDPRRFIRLEPYYDSCTRDHAFLRTCRCSAWRCSGFSVVITIVTRRAGARDYGVRPIRVSPSSVVAGAQHRLAPSNSGEHWPHQHLRTRRRGSMRPNPCPSATSIYQASVAHPARPLDHLEFYEPRSSTVLAPAIAWRSRTSCRAHRDMFGVTPMKLVAGLPGLTLD